MNSSESNLNMENKELTTNDDLEPENFCPQDDSKIVNKTDCCDQKCDNDDIIDIDEDGNYKYTKIDCLDEDPPIPGQRYLCISFISPEGVMNCKTRGFKLRGIYGSMSEAREACKKFQKIDKYFDVFVAEVGKWCPWDPTPQQIKETVYHGKDQNQIMKNIQEKEMKQLNEIVGRHKEKVDNSKVSHKERVANAMKQNVAAFKENQNAEKDKDDEEDENAIKIEKARKNGMKANKPSEKGKDNVRERLRRNVEKNAEKKANEYSKASLDDQKKKLEAETQRIKEQEAVANKMQQRSAETDEKLAKLKALLNQKKQEKTK